MHLSIVLPCSNEAKAIPTVLGDINAMQYTLAEKGILTEVVIFNDASSDDSENILNKFGFVHVLNSKECVGYGAALKGAFSKTRGDYIIFLDLDATYPVKKIEALYEHIIASKSDMVFGVREFFCSGMPMSRSIGNLFYRTLTGLLFGVKIRDLCTGMRVFKRDKLQEVLDIPANGLHFSIRLSLYALERNWKLSEIEIPYSERIGNSKLNLIVDGTSFLWEILRTKWVMLKVS